MRKHEEFIVMIFFVFLVLVLFVSFFNFRLPSIGHGYYIEYGDLSDYPDLFISKGEFIGHIVVGNDAPASDVVSAIDISTGLKGGNLEIRDAKLASEISNPFYENVISIGNPCDNSITDELLDNPDPCYRYLEEGKATISLFKHNGRFQILVYGKLDDDTRRAARVLKYYEDYDLDGFDICVTGSLNNPIVENKECEIIPYQELEEVPEEVEPETSEETNIESESEVIEEEQEEVSEFEEIVEEPELIEEESEIEPVEEFIEEPTEEIPASLWQKILSFFRDLFGG